MKTIKSKLLILSLCMLSFMSCTKDESPDTSIIPAILPVMKPGEIVPMRTKVKVNSDGTYVLPAEASLLTTQCFGKITVSFILVDGVPQTNTCNSPSGSSNQTNNVAGADEVSFTVQPGSHAEIILK